MHKYSLRKSHKTIEEFVRCNEQAFKAAEFLVNKFPKKYTSRIVKFDGVQALEVNHINNGYGSFYRYTVSRY